MADQLLELGLVADRHEAVLDVAPALLPRRDLVSARTTRVGRGYPPCLAFQRRGEEERLPLGRDLTDDPLDRGPEAHVEHAVCLVEHQHSHVAQRQHPALDEILQAPRRGDQDVRASRELGLALDARAAVDRRDGEGARVGDVAQLGDDLLRELTGGGEDESRRPRGLGGFQPLHHRHAERERLARPGG